MPKRHKVLTVNVLGNRSQRVIGGKYKGKPGNRTVENVREHKTLMHTASDGSWQALEAERVADAARKRAALGELRRMAALRRALEHALEAERKRNRVNLYKV